MHFSLIHTFVDLFLNICCVYSDFNVTFRLLFVGLLSHCIIL